MTKETMAFPQSMSAGSMAIPEGGLTMRDAFALAVLPTVAHGSKGFSPPDLAAAAAYEFADAMMIAREVK